MRTNEQDTFSHTRSATDRLNTILAVAEQMIGVQAGGSSQSSSSKPAFIWVLRDMQLQMKQEPKAEMTEKLEDSQLRKLKRSFREYDCFPLPRPVDSESQLQVSQHSFSQHLYNIFGSYAVRTMCWVMYHVTKHHNMNPCHQLAMGNCMLAAKNTQ